MAKMNGWKWMVEKEWLKGMVKKEWLKGMVERNGRKGMVKNSIAEKIFFVQK